VAEGCEDLERLAPIEEACFWLGCVQPGKSQAPAKSSVEIAKKPLRMGIPPKQLALLPSSNSPKKLESDHCLEKRDKLLYFTLFRQRLEGI
jgi:hypothetical protein